MSSVPENRRYLDSHEWHLLDGNVVTIGITQHAADELTDITYVDLPKVGAAVHAGKPFGEIESVKATAELNSGVTGTVVARNDALAEQPELVNNDPYESGWMIKVQVTAPAEYEKLMSAADYARAIA